MAPSTTASQPKSDSRRFPRTRYQGSKRKLAAAIVGLVDGVFIQWSLDPDAFDPAAAFDAFLRASFTLESAPAGKRADALNEVSERGGS